MIAEALAGKRIAITGATGFLGTALVERFLRGAPDCEIVCIVRPTRSFSPLQRIKREVIRNDCFDRLRSELGDRFDDEVARRVQAIAGDVSTDGLGLDFEGLKTLGSCDVVIHSAATVSFESPIDAAININLLGPSRVAQAMHKAKSKAHLVAVSTAYVSGSRRGDVREELVNDAWYTVDVDWKQEVSVAQASLDEAETQSRQLEKLASFNKQARRELGSAGTPLLAERAEKLRSDWVRDRLVQQGKARAKSLGWPDVYAYSKALGEKALLETRGDTPVTFVRPSIIESSLQEPVPGWIRGFRMAEPILLGVGRGLLKSFPGFPEGALDVIPVDKVVAAICTVAALPPPESPKVFHVASGTRQPLRYRDLVELVTEWYREHPLYDANGQAIAVFEWDYPTRSKVERQLQTAHRMLGITERVLRNIPLRRHVGLASAKLEQQKLTIERALGYVEIYGAYTESEARFRIDNTLALFQSLPESDQAAFHFDPIDINWRHYLHDIHLPSIIAQGRVRTKPTKKATVDRSARAVKTILSPDRQLAIFDLEHTLIPSTVLSSYLWFALKHLDTKERISLLAKKLPHAPALVLADKRDRGEFQRAFYRWFSGARIEQLRADSHELFASYIMQLAFPDGIRRIRAHRTAGHRTLLITGTLDIVAEGLRPLFDDVVASSLAVDHNGICTGELAKSPPVGEARALLLRDYAEEHGIDLEQCVAYADSSSDLPMLEAVGHPVVVNAEPRLASTALRRGWHAEHWRRETRSFPLPIPPRVTRSMHV